MITSLFTKGIKQLQDASEEALDNILSKIKLGTWQALVEKIRSTEDAEEKKLLKSSAPFFTPSGSFSYRNINGLKEHSGLICIDIDDIEEQGHQIDTLAERIRKDEYSFSVFKSIGGNGLAVLVKIDIKSAPDLIKRHKEAFEGLQVYFANKYAVNIDKVCSDITRIRFISFDPDCSINEKSKTFRQYVDKKLEKQIQKFSGVIISRNDISDICEQINRNCIDITNSEYDRFYKLAFSIASEYHESGRELFHVCCQNSPKYSHEIADKQYSISLRRNAAGITIATFIYYCKEAGIQVVGEDTRKISAISKIAKSGNRKKEDTIELILETQPNADKEIIREIVEKVYNSKDIASENQLSKLENLELFLNLNYSFRRNEITRFIELKDATRGAAGDHIKEVDSVILNSIWIRARKEVDDSIKFDEIDRLINSEFTPTINPLKEYFHIRENKYSLWALAHVPIPDDIYSPGHHGSNSISHIDKMCDSIKSSTWPAEIRRHFFKKWYVGIVASIFDKHSSLVLVLTGKYGRGKTEFFRRLLPEEIKSGYYSESKLDAGKDDDILMTQKILITDDEFGGKSKVEYKKLKELTSKEYFTLREPYGRKNIKLRRLAVLCGTSNENDIISDPTGNRRIIPIQVDDVNYEMYNSIDKEAALMEAYNLYLSGYNHELTREDMEILNKSSSDFEMIRNERELIVRYFKNGESSEKLRMGETIDYMQASEIKAHIERMSGSKISLSKIGLELKELGFKRVSHRLNGTIAKCYKVIVVQEKTVDKLDQEPPDDLDW